MVITLHAAIPMAPGAVSAPPTPRGAPLETPPPTETATLSLATPMRPSRPLSEVASMSALERAVWEIKTRSETALQAQARALKGDDVSSLLTG